MPSQVDLSQVKEYPFYDHEDQGGQTKSRNEPPERIQRQNVRNSRKSDTFKIDVDLYTCVHGTLDPIKREKASLIIFDFQLVCVKGSGLFKYAKFEFEFTNKADKRLGPAVRAYAPFRTEDRSNTTIADVEATQKLELKAGVDQVGTVEGSMGREKRISYQNRYFDRGTGGRYYQSSGDRYNGVWWSLNQSKKPGVREGIRANFRAAILLRRDSDDEFLGTFSLDTNAGVFYGLQSKINDWRGIVEPDDPINFDPGYPPQGECRGIDHTNLGSLAEGDKLKELVAIPGLQPMIAPDASN